MDAKRTQNPADRAVATIRAAIGRLALLLGDDDMATVDAAATGGWARSEAPSPVGHAGGGPAQEGPTKRHRAAIVAALVSFGVQEKAAIARALRGALERDPDPDVRAAAQACLTRLILGDLVSKPSATPYAAR